MARKPSNRIHSRKLEKIVAILKAIAHPVRLQIVNILAKGECSVGELSRMMGTTQTLTSQQLNVLKLAKVLKSKRRGNRVYYSFTSKKIRNIVKSVVREV